MNQYRNCGREIETVILLILKVVNFQHHKKRQTCKPCKVGEMVQRDCVNQVIVHGIQLFDRCEKPYLGVYVMIGSYILHFTNLPSLSHWI